MKKGSHHKPESKEKNRQKHLGKSCSEIAKEINRARFIENNPMKREEVKDMARERMKTNNPMFNPETVEQMRQTKLGVGLEEDHIEKIRVGTREALADPDVRRRMSESHEGISRPQWVRDKISKAKEGRKFTKTHCENIKTTRNLPEVKIKYSGENNPFFGKTHNEDAIEKNT